MRVLESLASYRTLEERGGVVGVRQLLLLEGDVKYKLVHESGDL